MLTYRNLIHSKYHVEVTNRCVILNPAMIRIYYAEPNSNSLTDLVAKKPPIAGTF